MQRLAQRLRAIKPKQAALFLAVAALAATACFGVREAGVGGSTAASGEGGTPEPLTLTLTATSQICETEQAIEYGGARQWEDEEGNWQIERYSDGWDNVSETPVTWAVSGGTPPYTLTIDGETRDEEQTYAGASGTASVSCALEFGETFIHDNEQRRNYRTQPEVDSGLKTIRATATDSVGATADASVDVYVILELGSSGDILTEREDVPRAGHAADRAGGRRSSDYRWHLRRRRRADSARLGHCRGGCRRRMGCGAAWRSTRSSAQHPLGFRWRWSGHGRGRRSPA